MLRDTIRVRLLVLATIVLVPLLLALSTREARAADVRGGSAVVVEQGEVVDDDLYALAQDVTVRGTVTGDVVALGGTVWVDGAVGGNITVAGGTLTIAGPVGGSVRAAGGTVTVESEVAEDVLLAGQSLTLSPSGRVGRDFVVAGGSATLDGSVGRNVRARVTDLTIRGLVGGGVDNVAQALRLADPSVIDGRLVSSHNQEAAIAPGAVVRAGVEQVALQEQETPSPLAQLRNFLLGWLQAVVGMLVLGLVFLLLVPRFARSAVETIGTSPWASLGIGFGFLVDLPILALFVFIVGLNVGGWWLSLMLLSTYPIVLALGYVVSSILAGRWLLLLAGRPGIRLSWMLLIGLTVLLILDRLPVLGRFVTIGAVLFGAGALLLATVRLLLRREAEPVA